MAGKKFESQNMYPSQEWRRPWYMGLGSNLLPPTRAGFWAAVSSLWRAAANGEEEVNMMDGNPKSDWQPRRRPSSDAGVAARQKGSGDEALLVPWRRRDGLEQGPGATPERPPVYYADEVDRAAQVGVPPYTGDTCILVATTHGSIANIKLKACFAWTFNVAMVMAQSVASVWRSSPFRYRARGPAL